MLPRSCCLPLLTGGSASALSLSRPAQASLTLRPTGLLNRLKRPLSRGSSPAGYPSEPLVSYQINRQLSGWNPPPLVIRAFGAHGQTRTLMRFRARSVLPPTTDMSRPRQYVRLVPEAEARYAFAANKSNRYGRCLRLLAMAFGSAPARFHRGNRGPVQQKPKLP